MFFIVPLIVSISVTSALKCNIVASGNLSVPDTSSAIDCAIGSLTCVKVVDHTRGTYTKQCQAMNCTMNGIQNAVANCQNTTGLGLSSSTCCCYGDGCNSSQQSSYATMLIATGAVFLGAKLFS